MEQSEDGAKGKLAVIKGSGKTKEPAEPAEKPPKAGEIYRALADIINRAPYVPAKLHLPREFFTIELSPGAREVATPNDDGSLRLVAEAEIVNALLEHVAGPLGGKKLYALTHTQAAECVRTWRGMTAPLTDVPYTRWLSEPGYCWRRIPFDLNPDAGLSGTDTWNALLTKIGKYESIMDLCTWIGALFEPRAYRQQYVWVHGAGGNGKGCIARFLHRVLGGASHFVSSIPKEPNQFWTAQFVRRRLVVVPDCDKHAFPASGLFKTLTGDDPVTIERKHQEAYTASLDAFFLFTSNEMPTLSSERADIRRAILVRMEGNGAWEADFEEKLWAEGGAFLWHCLDLYRQRCPTFGPIPIDEGELREHVASLEGEEQDLFDKWFVLDPTAATPATEVRRILRSELPQRGQRRAWTDWLRRAHALYAKSHRVGGVNAGAHYVGMRIIRQEYAAPMREDAL